MSILEEIKKLKQENEQLKEQLNTCKNIIKEVREYIASFNLLKNLGALEKEPISINELKHILELLDIGVDNEEN